MHADKVVKMEEEIEMVKTRRITFKEVPSLEDKKDSMVSETEVITRELISQQTIIREAIKKSEKFRTLS